MKKKAVLQIPSWFSTDGLVGSFFREQSEVLNKEFDIRFLYGIEHSHGYKSWLKLLNNRKRLFSSKVCGDKNIVYLFEYPSFIFLPSKLNYSIKKFFYRKQLQNLIKTFNWHPDLLHAQSTFDGGVIAYNLFKELKIPFIITEHNLFLLSNVDNLRAKEAKTSLEKAEEVLVVSNDKARQILVHDIKINPIVVGNLVNEDMFFYKQKQNEEQFSITIVGHFHWIKDYPTFFKAISLVRLNSSRKLRINCIGYNSWSSSDNTKQLRELAKSYGVEDLVNLIPNTSREEIREYYWNSDLFVLTSIAEGLSVSSLEALACGRPVFATHCGGIEDIINDSNGRIVPIRNAELLAKHISNYMNGYYVFDGKKISEDIIKDYGKEAFSKRLETVYKSVISSFSND